MINKVNVKIINKINGIFKKNIYIFTDCMKVGRKVNDKPVLLGRNSEYDKMTNF